LPTVSVVIPAYNAAPWIEQTIASCLAQTHTPLEVIVVDDASTDDTVQRVERFGAPVRCLRQASAGPAVARNRGIRAARGEFVAMIDADDTWSPNKLARQLELMQADPAIGLVFCDYTPFGEPATYTNGFSRGHHLQALARTGLGADAYRIDDDQLFQALLGDLFAWTSTLLMRKADLERSGMYDEDLRYAGEDWSLCLRLAKVCRFAYLDAPLAQRREHAGSLSREGRDNQQALIALRNLMRFPGVGAEDQAAMGRLAARIRFDLGYHLARLPDAHDARPYLREVCRDRSVAPGRRAKALAYLAFTHLPQSIRARLLRRRGA
jgi:glycosyltransferase involved in cell wall biosynthesis